jgi:hypothetical protein
LSFRSSRLTLGLLTGLVVVLLIGTGAAIVVSHQRQSTVAIATDIAASSSRSSPAASPSAGGSGNGSASTPAAEPPVLPGANLVAPGNPTATPGLASASNGTTAADGPSNNLTVQMSSSLGRSAHVSEIQQLLQGYFDAINQHNYTGWAQAVTSRLAGEQTRAEWLEAYATSVDSSIWMQSVKEDPMQVRVRFTSQQDPDLAPKDLPAGCIEWSITYRIESRQDHLVIGSTVPGSVTKAKC